MILEHIKKIAILRANGIGDFIFIIPALEALRSTYPDAEITLLGQHWHESFLRDRASPIDRVLVVPFSHGVYNSRKNETSPAALQAFFARARAEKFDLAIQMHGGGRYSNPFTTSLGARITAGFKSAEASPLDLWVPYIYFQREIIRYLELVSLVGAVPVTIEPRLSLRALDIANSFHFFREQKNKTVLLNPGATDSRRRWPIESFAKVGDALAKDNAVIFINGFRPEYELAKTLSRTMKYPSHILDCQNLATFAAILSRCDVVISNDSGPLHVAQAVGTPTVGLFWCGNLLNAGPVSYGKNRGFASWRLDCPICGTNCISSRCDHDASFVSDIPVDEVILNARELLSLGKAPARRYEA